MPKGKPEHPVTAAVRLLRDRGVVRAIAPCAPAVADRHSGCQSGGTSPFGSRKAMPVYLERTVLDLPRADVNGGKRGYLVGMAPADIVRVLAPTLVEVAQPVDA